ncbi:ABC transporter substrate-binding protein [Lacimicrobium alkaliphilum]|uniref:Periplasmic binding protein domain-containing protein n=1 Tax=Lacimicrobium alkaliphilum TaxID=1526571 RepID=A0ABQ1RU25_9ALTE|nr:ABC transporter substrate-binding protein [Lacimicrobium alkaliphilum]GGD79009.1 hypothetical protein GCM10011357_37520 [Lacimicrobium alkaliphilum]
MYAKNCLFALLFCAELNAVEVLFVSPSSPEDPFFSRVELYTNMAAESLNLHVETIYGGGHRIYQHQELNKRLQVSRPDYLVLQIFSGSGEPLFELLSQYPDMNVITLERLLLKDESDAIGLPGEKHRNWIGEIYIDNQTASRKLSRHLLKVCKEQAEKNRNGVVGLNGFHGYEADSREAGLKQAITAQSAFRLNQVVNAKWQRELAQQQTATLMQRYPDTSIFWSASDWLALGVSDALINGGFKQKFCIGGFDWLPEMLDAIKQQKVNASVGGHFMMGAWAMVMISDHLNFSRRESKNYNMGSVKMEMGLATRENAETVSRLLQPEFWKEVDFHRFSLTHSQRESYDFSLQRLMELIKK